MSFPHPNSHFALYTLPLNKSNSIYKYAANTLQKSDIKECEQFDQLCPISPICDARSTNDRKFSNLSVKLKNYIYKYQAPTNASPTDKNSHTNNFTDINPISSTSKMPSAESSKNTPTKSRVTSLDNSPTNTTPVTSSSLWTETTPSTSALDTADDLRL